MSFETSYLALREKEGRGFSDAQLRALPSVEAGHPQAEEWRLRGLSCARLLDWLARRGTGARVLEVGCGNGWLAHRMASCGADVTATDVLVPEIEQARRAFASVTTLRFLLGGLDAAELRGQHFDLVVFAASLQYFADPAAVIERALHLAPEVHILDSPFYAEAELAGARDRSTRHFAALGHPELAAHYHHHSRAALSGLRVETLYEAKPGTQDSPFPWLRVVAPGR
ncbi:class I SAM-dependent methyltransferase [Burkholderiaceae bacterium UC74_6]